MAEFDPENEGLQQMQQYRTMDQTDNLRWNQARDQVATIMNGAGNRLLLDAIRVYHRYDTDEGEVQRHEGIATSLVTRTTQAPNSAEFRLSCRLLISLFYDFHLGSIRPQRQAHYFDILDYTEIEEPGHIQCFTEAMNGLYNILAAVEYADEPISTNNVPGPVFAEAFRKGGLAIAQEFLGTFADRCSAETNLRLKRPARSTMQALGRFESVVKDNVQAMRNMTGRDSDVQSLSSEFRYLAEKYRDLLSESRLDYTALYTVRLEMEEIDHSLY